MNMIEKSNIWLSAPNSNDLDFFQKLFFLRSQVGTYEAIGEVSLKIFNPSGVKKYLVSVSFVDDTRSPQIYMDRESYDYVIYQVMVLRLDLNWILDIENLDLSNSEP